MQTQFLARVLGQLPEDQRLRLQEGLALIDQAITALAREPTDRH
jgi:hypothetical protein